MKWIDHFTPLQNLILGADLNVHLSLLGYRKEDSRGTILNYLLLSNDLTLINDTEAPATYIGQPNRPCKTNPDVTLCTKDLVDYVDSWYVDVGDESTPDHRYIHFSLSLKPEIVELKRYKTRYTNFKKFNKLLKPKINNLSETLSETKTKLQLDEWLADFNTIIRETCDQSLKTKKLSNIRMVE